MAPRHDVVLLPGIVLPAEPAYSALIEVLGDRVDAVAKDLELYVTDEPPMGYGLALEIDGVLRAADAHGFGRFHIVGYSAGGAASLAFAADHSDRLLSLALLEPAWAGNDRTPQEEAVMQGFRALELLPPDQSMVGFQRLQLARGVDPPPPPEGSPPAWMAKRPAGIRAILDAFDDADLDAQALRAYQGPVYFAPRRPQQPRLLRRDGQSAGGAVPGLHDRDVPGAPPLRSAAPRRARTPGQLVTRAVAAG